MSTRKKPGPTPGTKYVADEDRMVMVSLRLPQRIVDKLRRLGNHRLLIRDAVEDKYGP